MPVVRGQPQQKELEQIQTDALTRNRRYFETWFTYEQPIPKFSCVDSCVLRKTLNEDQLISNNLTSLLPRDYISIIPKNTTEYCDVGQVTWYAALKYCRRRGMMLATFDPVQLQRFIGFIASNKPYKYISETASLWSGGTNIGKSKDSYSNYSWVDSGIAVRSGVFQAGSKISKRSHCLFLNKLKLTTTAEFEAGKCKDLRQFVCQVPPKCIITNCIQVTTTKEPDATSSTGQVVTVTDDMI